MKDVGLFLLGEDMKCFLAILGLLILSNVYAQGGLRLVAPTTTELEDYSKRPGEIAYDDAFGALMVWSDGAWRFATGGPQTEKIPYVVKNSSTNLRISAGKLWIGQRFHYNENPINCSYSSTGVGGYEVGTTAPTTSQVEYLYLTQDPSNHASFKCIMSTNSSVVASLSEPVRKIGAFWTSGEFYIENGKTVYRSTIPQDTLVAGNYTSTCTAFSFAKASAKASETAVQFACNGSGQTGNNFQVYVDSSCTVSLLSCLTTNFSLDAKVLNFSGWQLYYKGTVVGAAHALKYISSEEDIIQHD